MLDGDVIREGTALRHPNLERAVAFLGGVPLAPLLQAASLPTRPDNLMARWMRHAPPSVCRQIFEWLWQRGVLETRE